MLYTTDMTSSMHPTPFSTNTCTLMHDVHTVLNSEVSDQEIKCAMFSFKPYKAPGPDGFHLYIKNIFRSKKIPKNLNSTLICLILKPNKPETIHQFRPIGLCNTLYKGCCATCFPIKYAPS